MDIALGVLIILLGVAGLIWFFKFSWIYSMCFRITFRSSSINTEFYPG